MEPLREVRKSVAEFCGDSGMCSDDSRVLDAINEARRILYPVGDWKEITDPLCIRPYACAITLPADYEYAKKGYVCSGRIAIQNDWFTPIYDNFESYCGSCINPLKQIPGKHATFDEWPEARPRNNRCCTEEGFYIGLVWESDNDCGTEITFNGIGAKRRRLSLTRTIEGLAFKEQIARPGEQPFVKIETVIKPRTDGRLRVYGYDGANTRLLALYEPDDINPQYARYAVGGARGPIVLKAKKRFRPVLDDTEFVDIHTDALIHALQAITERKSRNVPGFNANLAMARDFLNRELQGPESTATSPMRMSDAYRVTGLIE